MTIDLRHFKCFVAVAEELHFHRAAKRLGVAQPALSRTISNLERELGVTLFLRSNRSVKITTAGETLLKGCTEVLNKAAQVVEDTRRVDQGKIGTLRIGYTDNAINGKAPSLLKTFQDAQPDIDLRLIHTVTSDQLVALEDDSFDFGFITGFVARPGFEQCRIQREQFVGVVYEGHALANRKSLSLKDFANEPIVHGARKQWEHFYSYLTPLCHKAGFELNIAQEGLATSDILRLVACGMGITILTESVLETLGPGLIVIPFDDVTDKLDTVVIWKSGNQNSAKEHFISYLRDQLGNTMPIRQHSG
jgi:DNA-binding transcriptional LysR family regulator